MIKAQHRGLRENRSPACFWLTVRSVSRETGRAGPHRRWYHDLEEAGDVHRQVDRAHHLRCEDCLAITVADLSKPRFVHEKNVSIIGFEPVVQQRHHQLLESGAGVGGLRDHDDMIRRQLGDSPSPVASANIWLARNTTTQSQRASETCPDLRHLVDDAAGARRERGTGVAHETRGVDVGRPHQTSPAVMRCSWVDEHVLSALDSVRAPCAPVCQRR